MYAKVIPLYEGGKFTEQRRYFGRIDFTRNVDHPILSHRKVAEMTLFDEVCLNVIEPLYDPVCISITASRQTFRGWQLCDGREVIQEWWISPYEPKVDKKTHRVIPEGEQGETI